MNAYIAAAIKQKEDRSCWSLTFQTSFISSDLLVIAWAPMAPSPTPTDRVYMSNNA